MPDELAEKGLSDTEAQEVLEQQRTQQRAMRRDGVRPNRNRASEHYAGIDDAIIVIPLPGFGTLRLPREVFEQHLQCAPISPAAEAAPRKLIDAEQLEEITGVPATWWASQARERRLPFHKFGKYVRFDINEVFESDEFKRPAVEVCISRLTRNR
jgi:hypothetical protein